MKDYDDDGNYEDPDDDNDIDVDDEDHMTEPGQFSSNDKREGVGGKQGRAHQDLREEGVQLANLKMIVVMIAIVVMMTTITTKMTMRGVN